MTRYEPLGRYLTKTAAKQIAMTFREVESVIGRKLPPSAYRHRPWWANEARGHSHAKAWLQAGYETEQVDMAARTLVFRRVTGTPGPASVKGTRRATGTKTRATTKRSGHPLIGSMKGTFTIEPGWDLTKPAIDSGEWEDVEENLQRPADLIEKGLSGKS